MDNLLNQMVTIHGQTKSVGEWCDYLNISFDLVKKRIELGSSIEMAILTRIGRLNNKRPDIDTWYMNLCQVIKTRGTCIRREVGCILVDEHGFILSTGYNSVPTGMAHCTDFPCAGAACKSGEGLNLCCASHAEEVALMKCPDIHKIKTCYTTSSPCELCVRRLMSTSCKRIVFLEQYPHDKSKTLWTDLGREWIQL